ncbi:hypothetical protein [Aquamicrobium sp. LC103]|uniref:hypothetical protein n=1 Tax=Aquamicrobium sp. LC103 TaxID=1120658 RepID=UPI00063E7525|nr:hypothetical protein [Aquamicrobium sp. LC103]TKT81238.1 hypothetical protein XW59_005050 [Aquamicrobium sp. LC103]
METEKPWYTSRTIWASIITVMAVFAGAFGLPLDDGEQAELVELILQGVAAAAGIAAIAGRLMARTRIG